MKKLFNISLLKQMDRLFINDMGKENFWEKV